MQGSTLALGISRALQILFAAVVLGVSVVTVNWVNKLVTECKEIDCGSVNAFRAWNPQFEYGAFVGAFGLLDAFIGIAAIFVGAIPWIATAALDGLAAVFYLAGGIKIAVWLSAVGCHDKYNDNVSRCHEIEADSAFMFLGFIITLVLVGLGCMWLRHGSGKRTSAV